MTKQLYIFFFLLLGIFLMPTVAYACEEEMKECCVSQKENPQEEDCHQKCQDQVCCCPHFSFHFFLSSTPKIALIFFPMNEQKHYSLYIENVYSSPLNFIWRPPITC